jgi:altronate hydrolase
VGRWVHTHDIKTNLEGILDYKYNPDTADIEKKISQMATKKGTFKGFVRSNGKVGIRNEIWIIPTVGCVNNIATALAKEANAYIKGSVDEVVAFTHNYGCSQTGDDQEHTRTILSDLINHPNAGGVLVLGLGCENSNIDVLMPYIGSYDEKRVKFLVCQKSDDEMEDGINLLKELIEEASKMKDRMQTSPNLLSDLSAEEVMDFQELQLIRLLAASPTGSLSMAEHQYLQKFLRCLVLKQSL